MLKVIKQKAKDQDAVKPRIDMTLILSEQKMSWNYDAFPPQLLGDSQPKTVTVASVASSTGSILSCITTKEAGINDAKQQRHSKVQHVQQPTVPSAVIGSISEDSSGKVMPASDSTSPFIHDARSPEDSLNVTESVPRPIKRRRLNSCDSLSTPSITLLSQEEDEEYLKSPLHVFVRKQIEVFTATPTQLSEPAPGRKRPIQLHQVGLRCIYCKHLPVRERVKRAGSFPSSVSRLYHAVSDFQFDHLPNCTMLPPDVRASFQVLKEDAKSSKRSEKKPKGKVGSSTSTAKYYEESARMMGMVDGPNGIFMTPSGDSSPSFLNSTPEQLLDVEKGFEPLLDVESVTELKKPTSRLTDLNPIIAQPHHQATHETTALATSKPEAVPIAVAATHDPKNPFPMPLASAEDPEFLNALHVFCRKNIEFFSANEEDIASPAPGRKTRPQLGQVGIRCVHCAKLPAKERVKRSVCYPPTVSSIYHATSNMKFDHFKICPALPEDARAEFEALKTSCIRRGISGSSNNSVSSTTAGRAMSSSTSEYYRKSAIAKGLIDSESGIRFKMEQSKDTAMNLKARATETQKVTSSGKGGKAIGVLSGLSALAMAACHAS